MAQRIVSARQSDERVTMGLGTFGDLTRDSHGDLLPYGAVIRNIVDQAVHAESVGVDAFGIGEHHRDDFAVSAPEIVLAAIAARTERITLGTATTVLTTDDPIRLYERFATLAGISRGRGEMILGRGAFTESFPLFGVDLADYDVLSAEKTELIRHLQTEGPITWSGTHRPPLRGQEVFPKTEAGLVPAWIGVGGSPQSVIRAAQGGFPVALALLGVGAERLAPLADLYRRALEQFGRPRMPLAVHAPGFVAATDEEAIDLLWPHVRDYTGRIASERGGPAPTRDCFEAEVRHGAYHVGSPDTVAKKIVHTLATLDAQRFDLKYAHGAMPHEALMETIGLYGAEVIPRVHRLRASS